MKLIPPIVYRFNSAAEEKIFKAMKRAPDEGMIILHSLNLPEHDYKQWAEADFVIVSQTGVMVIEVKGGRVACEDGIWTFTNRYGETARKSESPFEQARGARLALEKLLRKKMESGFVDRVNFGSGVMFPDIDFDTDSVEISREIIFDLPFWERRDLAGWFRSLTSYWAKRTGRTVPLSLADVKRLVQALRPTFELVPPLMQRVDETMNQLVRLTEDQYRYLDILVLQKRVVIEGGAGTGKTLLAIEAARRLDDDGRKVAFICRSPVLSWHVRTCLNGTAVEVFSLASLQEKNPSELQTFNAFVIDEGQDFLHIDVISILDRIIDGGLEHGSWLFFMDANHQGGIYENFEPDVLAYLKSAGAPWPLKDNCRNTLQIAMHTMLYTGGDIGRCRALGDGLKVVESGHLLTKEDELAAVEQQLEKWVDQDQVPLGDITILSPVPYDRSVIAGLNKRWRRRVHVVDASFGGRWLPTNLTFSTVRDFKGLENRCIMLVDLGDLTDTPESVSTIYVGMTRANAHLWIAMPAAFAPVLERFKANNAVRLARYLGNQGT